jgi:hypothetical protein
VIELLYWDGCPSHPEALELLRDAAARAGRSDEIVLREVTSQAEAEALRFPGSPTIRVDGGDVQPVGPEGPRGLTCRIYRRRDGTISPLPDRADLREALRKSVDREGSKA